MYTKWKREQSQDYFFEGLANDDTWAKLGWNRKFIIL